VVDRGLGLSLLFGKPALPFSLEARRESVLHLGIPRATVLEQARRKLRKDLSDANAKPSTAAQERSDVGDRTPVRGRFAKNEKETSNVSGALAPTGGLGGDAISPVSHSGRAQARGCFRMPGGTPLTPFSQVAFVRQARVEEIDHLGPRSSELAGALCGLAHASQSGVPGDIVPPSPEPGRTSGRSRRESPRLYVSEGKARATAPSAGTGAASSRL
jgi:hypothetical protein